MDAGETRDRHVDLAAEAGGGEQAAFLDSGVCDAEAGAIGEGKFEEEAFRAGVVDQGGVEAEGDDRGARDADRAGVGLELDDGGAEVEQAAGDPVAVGQPEHLGVFGLSADLTDEGLDLRRCLRAGPG